MQKLRGLIAAPFTAFAADGELDLSVVEKQFEHLTANGVRGALVGGTTGECGSMTLGERIALTDHWCSTSRDSEDFVIVAHVGHSCLKDSQELAIRAAESGADAIAALSPYYFKPASVEMLVEHCSELASATPDLPFYFYHLPSITGVNFSVISFLRAMGDKIPNFAGIKYTHEDLYDLGLCLEFENRRYDVLCGRDEVLLPGLALGAVGAVGSTYNYMAPVYHELIDAFEKGEMRRAQEAQEKARQVINVMIRFGGIPAAKSIMKMVGVDCGDARLPFEAVVGQKYNDLEKELADVGFFEFCSRASNSGAASRSAE
jgi:Dihydrodipicolinate synthase/N-acetylneuraminate lyase